LLLAGTESRAQAVLDRLESTLRGALSGVAQKPEPGFLGLVGDDRQTNGTGVRVLDVMPGGPADTSGIKTGDLITAVAGRPIRTMNDFAAALQGATPGTVMAMQVDRLGQPTTLSVALGRRPAQPPAMTAAQRPIVPTPLASPPSESARIDALEKRVADLERRLGVLEQSAKGSALSQP
jgi:serine protease Do